MKVTTTPGHDLETRNRRVMRVLLGIVAALVTTCFWVATRW